MTHNTKVNINEIPWNRDRRERELKIGKWLPAPARRERAGTGKAFLLSGGNRAGTGKALSRSSGNGREPGKRFPDQRGTGGNPEMNSDSGQGTGQINGLTNALVLSDPLEKIPGRKWKGHIILNHQKWFGTHSTRASKIGLWYAPYIGRLSDSYICIRVLIETKIPITCSWKYPEVENFYVGNQSWKYSSEVGNVEAKLEDMRVVEEESWRDRIKVDGLS